MRIYNDAMLEEYMKNDWILSEMERAEKDEICMGGWKSIPTHVWMLDAAQKRMIYADVYGDILKRKNNVKVLDVGGGLTSLSPILAKNTEYYLLDFFAHGDRNQIKETIETNHIHWIDMDWYLYENENEWDIVIANDIFPNVDQRLELFLQKFLPKCKEIRLTATFFNSPRFYVTKRIDAEEILTLSAWDGEMLETKLCKYNQKSDTTKCDWEKMRTTKESVFPNGRQVAYTIIKGLL